MKVLFNKLKLRFYIFVLIIEDHLEDIINRLNGREVDLDSFDREAIVYQQQNSKLRRGVKRIVQSIYDANGKLKDSYKTSDADLVELAQGQKLSTYEKLQLAKIQQRVLENPTDESGTDEAMVQHNVKNAWKYGLNQKMRKLQKELTQARMYDRVDEVKRLRKEINAIKDKLQRGQ